MTEFNEEKSRQEWRQMFASFTNSKLIEYYNSGIGVKCWGLSRAAYVDCLGQEILRRKFKSDFLFNKDSKGNCKSLILNYRVVLIGDILVRYDKYLN